MMSYVFLACAALDWLDDDKVTVPVGAQLKTDLPALEKAAHSG